MSSALLASSLGPQAIDLFAGAGGFTTGATQAGVFVRWAANHWPQAIETHRHNHPHTEHFCQDLHQADWTHVPPHDILLASPSCQGHAFARGKERPHHDASRATAWAVVSCAEAHRPEVLVVENVLEYRHAWSLYPVWKDALTRLGYTLSENVLHADEFGVPQARTRLFIVGTRSRAPFQIQSPQLPKIPVRAIIDWTCDTWSPIITPTRSAATLRRIEAGRARYGPEFLIAYYGAESGGRSLDVPLGTVTTRARFALICGDRMRMLTIPELRRAMGFPETYWLPTAQFLAIHLLGNAVCPPVAREILTQLRAA